MSSRERYFLQTISILIQLDTSPLESSRSTWILATLCALIDVTPKVLLDRNILLMQQCEIVLVRNKVMFEANFLVTGT